MRGKRWVEHVCWRPLSSPQAGSGIEFLQGAVNAEEEPGADSNLHPLFMNANHAAM